MCHHPGHIILGGPRYDGGAGNGSMYLVGLAPAEEGAAIQRCSADALNPPAAPVLIKPTNVIYETNPLFVWQTIPLATQYLFQITDYNGDIFHEEIFEKVDICGIDNKCKINIALPYGTYSWKVQARHADGIGDWSGP